MSDGVYLTGFGDEISADLDVQLRLMKKLGLVGLDLRSAFGKNVLQLTDQDVEQVKSAVEAHGLRVQCIGSPVNKVKFTTEGASEELGKLRRSVAIAKSLCVGRIRIFSPEAAWQDNDPAWPDVRSWMADQVAFAEDEGVLLLHENDGTFFGAYPHNCRLLLEEFGGPSFRAVFDFANTVLLGYRPMNDWFPWLLPYLDTLHIKDAKDGKVVAAGEGDGQIAETLEYLFSQDWQGPLTLEPHAQVAGAASGFSGEQAFEYAVAAFRTVLDQVGAKA
jgi:3-dehydroshikimate dehydratase